MVRSWNLKGWEDWVCSALKTENLRGSPKGSEKMVPNSSQMLHRVKRQEKTNTSWKTWEILTQHKNSFQFIFETYGCSKLEQVTQSIQLQPWRCSKFDKALSSPALFSPGLGGRLEEGTFGGLFPAGDSEPAFQIYCISLTLDVPPVVPRSTDHVTNKLMMLIKVMTENNLYKKNENLAFVWIFHTSGKW